MSDFDWLDKCLEKCIKENKCVICSDHASIYLCNCGAMVCSILCANVDKLGPTMHKTRCKKYIFKSESSH